MNWFHRVCGPVVIGMTLIASTASADRAALERAKVQKSAAVAAYQRSAKHRLEKASSPGKAPGLVHSIESGGRRMELLVNASFEREAKSGAKSDGLNAGVFCRKEDFQLDFTTAGNFIASSRLMKSAVIFPGAICAPQSVLNGGCAPVRELPARKPIELTMLMLDHPDGQGAPVVVPTPVNLANVNTGRQALLAQYQGATIPMASDAEARYFVAGAEIAAELLSSGGAAVPLEEFGVPGSAVLEASLNVSASARGRVERFSIRLFEPMYTVAVGSGRDEWFQSASAFNSVEGVMVNSITYGRMLHLYVEGVGGSQQLQALFRDKLGVNLLVEGSPIGIDAEREGKVDQSATFEIRTMKATIIGGNSAEGRALESTLLTGQAATEKLKAYLEARSSTRLSGETAAMPIAYSLIDVRTGLNMGVRVLDKAEVVSECRTARKLKVELLGIKPTHVVDNALGAEGDNEDLFGELSVQVENARTIDGPSRKTLFDFNQSAPLRLNLNESDGGGKALVTTVHPDDLAKFVIKVSETIKDDFDSAEELVNGGRKSASYEVVGGTNLIEAVDLDKLRRSGSDTHIVRLKETSGDSTLEAKLRLSLID